MVVKRTIAHLRTRPHHERHAVALVTSIVVMMLLFIIWGFFFLRKLQYHEPVPQTEQISTGVQQ